MSQHEKDRVYAAPQLVTDLNQCTFYHTMTIPGYGLVEGEWDLRQAAKDFTGRMDLEGKRVLEVGPASGFLTFYMERQGADVTCVDLPADRAWDIVPYYRGDPEQCMLERKEMLSKQHNAFWLCHRAFDSRAKVVYSSVYDLPEQIGVFDVGLASFVLLHLRQPLRALEVVARHTAQTIVVTECVSLPVIPLVLFTEFLARIGFQAPLLSFAAQFGVYDTWWFYTPSIIRRFLELVGFEEHRTTLHTRARMKGHRSLSFTVVGHRTGQFQR